MNEHLIFLSAMILATFFFLAAAIYFFRLKPERVPAAERLCRNRYLGGAIALAALSWCEPQAAAICWDWMTPYLWPLVILFAVLAFFFVDYLFARAAAGLVILASYYYLQESFALQLTFALPGVIAAWSIGLAGILVSAKPCYLRDFFRVSGKKPIVRLSAMVYFLLLSAMCIAVLFLNWKE